MKKRVFLFSKCIRMHTIVCKINYSGIGFDCEICLYMVHYQLNWALTSGAVRNERIAVTSNGGTTRFTEFLLLAWKPTADLSGTLPK